MKARDLYEKLSASDPSTALREAIAPAMPAYRYGLAERGRVAPVVIESDGALLVIANEHLANLCEIFMAGHLDAVELGYVATALELAPDFQFVSGQIEDIAGLLAEGTATSENVAAVLRVLREHAA